MTNIELSYDEVALLLDLMGEVTMSKFNTTSKKSILRKLLATPNSVSVGVTETETDVNYVKSD